MKAVNTVYFGGHLIPERKLGIIENDVVRQVKKTYKEYGISQFDTNLIRAAASLAVNRMTQFANDLEKNKSKKK